MKNLLIYVPGHRIEEFKVFVKSKTGQSAEEVSDDELKNLSSLFIYGEEENKNEQKTNDSQLQIQAKPKIKSEKEIFDEVVFKQLNGIKWREATSIVWLPAVTKDTADCVYAIEVYRDKVLLKRIVIRNKQKSIRFLMYVNNIFEKELNEKY